MMMRNLAQQNSQELVLLWIQQGSNTGERCDLIKTKAISFNLNTMTSSLKNTALSPQPVLFSRDCASLCHNPPG